ELTNTSASPIKGTLRGSLRGATAPIEFFQNIELAPNEKREIVFAPESTKALNLSKPRLWWPYQMGGPYLHHLKLQFVQSLAHSAVSDSQKISVGLLKTDSDLPQEGSRLLRINGKPILIRGGGWAPDMLLRVDEARREAEFRYVKEMGLNTIRLEGK